MWVRNKLHYTLTDQDREFVERYAEYRTLTNRGENVRDQRVSGDSWEVERQGLAGEVAFARMLGLRLPRSTDLRSRRLGQDKGGDFELPSGLTVDVKTPLKDEPWTKLLVPTHTTVENSADMFALVLGSWVTGEYRLMGFIGAQEMLRQERLGYPIQPLTDRGRERVERLRRQGVNISGPSVTRQNYIAKRSELLKPSEVISLTS
jgi:hypothetical protein